MMMKLLARTASFVILASAVVILSNCGGDDPEKSAQEVQLGKLSKTWNIVSATLDGTTRTGDFTNFTLTFSGTFNANANNGNGPYNFSVSGSRPDPSPWPATGTWSFVNIGTGDSGSLVRNDDVPMVYSINSAGQLTISDLICTSCNYTGARTEAVNGNWTFVFN